ncbi:MAG: hypothetical protein JWN32_1028 [Solirubrobacterales bacterium]|nr:hypothetical protein [Solirubrobacterales bacterium]
MIINSPVGRFPFEVTGVGLVDGRIRLEGAMGTWPTSVEVTPSELPRIAARLVPRSAAVGAAVLGSAAALALAARRRSRRAA